MNNWIPSVSKSLSFGVILDDIEDKGEEGLEEGIER